METTPTWCQVVFLIKAGIEGYVLPPGSRVYPSTGQACDAGLAARILCASLRLQKSETCSGN